MQQNIAVIFNILSQYLRVVPPLGDPLVVSLPWLHACWRDALESRLQSQAGVQGRLAGAVVKQVAGG
jgi:hypothetical protein